MKEFFRHLLMIPRACRDALMTSAKDPREVYATLYQSQQEPPGKAQPSLEQLRKSLHGGFSGAGSDVGLKALSDLALEYEQLRPVLKRRKETDPLSVAQVPALVEETFRQGLSVLEDALELTQAVRSPDLKKLEGDAARLEMEIESLRGDERQAVRLRIREETLESHKELLEMIRQQLLRVAELLHQSDRCQASLRRTRIELAALRADGSRRSVSAVTEALKKTIDQAREVQDEMKRLGF